MVPDYEKVISGQEPIDPRQRIEAVDMVRGFALFGVLLVNMFNFGAYSIIWNDPGDEIAFSVMRFFFETKSWRLFAFLFGFGFALQMIRAEQHQEPAQSAVVFNNTALLEAETAEVEEDRRTHVYAVGSVREVMADNARLKNPFARLLGPESSLPVFAMFLLGLYAGRRRISLIRRMFWWGLSIGLVCMTAERILNATLGYAVFREQQATIVPQFFGDIIFVYGSTLLALGYAAGITLLAQRAFGKQLLSPFGAAGRIALTIYISGSLMFGMLFYGFAFGQAFYLGPAAVMGYAVLFFLFAVWWTNRFRFGPMEWLWRALTYLKLPPMTLPDRSYEKA
jgi:uncharacterized membrane protein YeiB